MHSIFKRIRRVKSKVRGSKSKIWTAELDNVSAGHYKILLKSNCNQTVRCCVYAQAQYATHVKPTSLFAPLNVDISTAILLPQLYVYSTPKIVVVIDNKSWNCGAASVELIPMGYTHEEMIEHEAFAMVDFVKDNDEYHEMRNVYGKPTAYLIEVCSLKYSTSFANVPPGNYSVFMKVFLGNGSVWSRAINRGRIEVATYIDDVQTSIAYKKPLAYDPDLRAFQLIQGPDFQLEETTNLDIWFENWCSGWKNDVYFASMMIIRSDLVKPGFSLKDMAYKKLINGDPRFEDIDVAMQTVMPKRKIVTFKQSIDNDQYIDDTFVDPLHNDHNSEPYSSSAVYDGPDGCVIGGQRYRGPVYHPDCTSTNPGVRIYYP